jgi:pyruvate/2-oxoglutarate dehydrogenase complex dihydrolipoamide acyltransferase (E2) component
MDRPNRVVRSVPLRGEQAFVYGFKERAQRHHCLGYATFAVELDRLEPLRKLYSRQVRPITYLPVYVKAVARTLERSPEANSILFRKLFGFRVVQFERVDVNLPITRLVDGKPLTFVATVRDAPSKTLAAIQEELTEQQRCPPEKSFAIRRIRRFAGLPLWLARLAHWRMKWSPAFYIRNVGTCGLTLLEGDWVDRLFPIAPTSVVFGLGAARREPVVRGDAVAVGWVLKCSLMVDNYVISGPTGSRLVKDFKGLLESGSVVREELGPTDPAAPS